jgi:hypothetical protein
METGIWMRKIVSLLSGEWRYAHSKIFIGRVDIIEGIAALEEKSSVWRPELFVVPIGGQSFLD